ncbi:hypothetical protein BDA99DRAFT_539238 [Phascolomyces articulosus]|uniref:Uncharacterized protein n=1 Tax=Phascolomyces articulosus TaxID=60185 RepID=A0AAD5PC34_9FUNG|nr:hypothetical protein BDA99DRAFT_539238 [Phascolomyces articulosus]
MNVISSRAIYSMRIVRTIKTPGDHDTLSTSTQSGLCRYHGIEHYCIKTLAVSNHGALESGANVLATWTMGASPHGKYSETPFFASWEFRGNDADSGNLKHLGAHYLEFL